MNHIDFYLDFISPFAYLAFEQLPQTLQGLSHSMTYKPVLFAGLLKHHGQLGPAEVPPKRDWIYRQVCWQADQLGIALKMPQSHPFNPLGLLRLSLACAPQGQQPNRYVCETIFRHVWQSGLDAAQAQRLEALTQQLAPVRSRDDPAVKDQLRQNTEDAIALGLFGVPSFVVNGRLFWGQDSLPMLRAYLMGDGWFETRWHEAASVAQGVRR